MEMEETDITELAVGQAHADDQVVIVAGTNEEKTEMFFIPQNNIWQRNELQRAS